MTELLAPAGDMDSLSAALQSGADSVYLGAQAFSARQGAKNFDDAGLKSALDEAHGVGASIYVALNTLLFDHELKSALGLAEALYKMGADAFIVQDIGLAGLLRRYFPDMPLHASTQACIHDAGGLEFAHTIGFSRAVLSRELSLSDILELAASPVELEVFVHGALCSAFSGGCLFSSLVGGRSGNRGACAQPCRLPYSFGPIIAGGDFARSSRRPLKPPASGEASANVKPSALLSLKDLCLIEHIGALQEAGVMAFKIEGRMRGAAYVGALTRAYRNVLDGAPASEQAELLGGAAHHGGYCTGYILGDTGLAEPERPASWRMPEAKQSAPYARNIPLRARLELLADRPARLRVSALGQEAEAIGHMPEKAQSAPLTFDKAQAALSKLGDTPFELKGLSAEIGDSLFIPAAKLNELRREAVGALSEAVRRSRRREYAKNAKASEQSPHESRLRYATIKARYCRGELRSPVTHIVGAIRNRPPSRQNTSGISRAIRNRPPSRQNTSGISRAIRNRPPSRQNISGISRAITNRPNKYETVGCRIPSAERALIAQVVSPEQAEAASASGADMIIFRPLDWHKAAHELLAVRAAAGPSVKLLLRLPSVLRRADWSMAAPIVEKARDIADGALASNAGQAAYLLERFGLVLGGHELNITNAEAARFWRELGVRGCVSAELTMRRARDILELCPDIVAYGRVPLMTLLHCPLRDAGANCGDCAGDRALCDRMGEKFPMERERLGSCHVNVLNAHRLDLLRKWPEFPFSPRVLFSDESPEDVALIVKAYRDAMDGKGIPRTFGETTGRYYAKSV